MDETGVESTDIYRVDYTYGFLSGIDSTRPPKSITIPEKYLDAMANMERQYWEIKSKNYDVIILFKKGKFYELYDQDAVIGHREFGLKLSFDTTNRGKMRLAGVPEQSFTEWARLFVFHGYKVGRVEQMKDDDESPSKNHPKVMPRELVEILTPGTITDPAMISGYGTIFILALYPLEGNGVDGFAADLSRRVVYECPCHFSESCTGGSHDSAVFLMVSALLQQLRPREIILPRGEHLEKSTLFLKRLTNWMESEGCHVEYIESPDLSTFHGNPAREFMSHYLRSLKQDRAASILTEAQLYTTHLTQQTKIVGAISTPLGSPASLLTLERREDYGLVLDATTVSNLELVSNLRDGGEHGSLNSLLNRCCTNGGRRLFRSWVLRPSASSRVIAARQAAVRFILTHRLNEAWGEGEGLEKESMTVTPIRDGECLSLGAKRTRNDERDFETRFNALAGVDFERNLSRLADLRSDNAQVVFIDPLAQYKKHLHLILATVQAFDEMVAWSRSVQEVCKVSPPPQLLRELWENIDAAAPAVAAMEQCFDRKTAASSGLIIPSRGTCAAYDLATDRLEQIETKLHAELARLRKEFFGGADVTFSDIGKDRFLVDVPIKNALKSSNAQFVERARSTKSVKYVVAALEGLVEEHKKVTVEKSNALLLVLRSVAGFMCDYFPILHGAMAALSYLDCLFSLSSLQRRGLATVWPTIDDDSAGAHIAAVKLTHPFLSRDSVPNTLTLDDAHGRILVLTGPNMAGKSTLMRTMAVNVVIAQMGGPIFGESMRLAPVSRIFTRIGARDASHRGQSTLYVELSETADILRHADQRSLCLVDELGRGTSTHDGYAIAHATLSSLQERRSATPLVLFSTHYHVLAQEQATSTNAGVQLGFMDFALSEAKPGCVPAINFLYRLAPGICTRSYGVEVALLAGIHPALVNTASIKSRELAKRTEQQQELDVVKRFVHSV